MLNRLQQLAAEFRADDFGLLPCPYCHQLASRPAAPDLDENPESSSAREHEAWEPEWIHGTFHVKLVCGACNGVARALGTYRVREGDRGTWEIQDYVEFLTVTLINPSIPIIAVPDGTPDNVQELILAASTVWLAEPRASANLLRQAVEAILTDKGIARSVVSNNKRRPINLHDRILRYQTKNKEAAEALMAAKWLGNEGSHSGNITRLEVLQHASFLRVALELIYQDGRQLKRTIEKVNKTKGVKGLR